MSGTNNRIWFLTPFCCPRRVGSTMLLRQIDGPLFVFLLLSEDTAKYSTRVLIACFDEESDRSLYGEIV